MIKNYLKISFRNLLKYKLHTGINLIGLSLGIGVGILILFFVQFELSFDNFHPGSERIYRVKSHEMVDGEMTESFSSPMILEPTFRNEFPQIEAISGMVGSAVQAKLPDESSQNQPFLMVNPDFLKIFDFQLLQGDPSTQLKDKYSVLVTEALAKKYFGEANPIGKSIRMKMGENYQEYVVSGLLEDVPANSSLRFDMLMPIENMDFFTDEEGMNSWYNVWGSNIVKLQSEDQVASIHRGMEALMKKSLGEEYVPGEFYYSLVPISEMHFSEAAGNGGLETTKASLLWILAGIAFLVLLIACINFTTMAIGRATTRAREVGVRKTMGANFPQLIFQFLTEAFLTTLAATILGVVLAELILPTFNTLFEKELNLVYGPIQLGILAGLILLITAMAGAYPAFFLSGLRPIKVLKGNLSIHFGKQGLRKGLVAFQFFISFLLIASTLIMVNQMNAIRNFELGFNQEQVVVIEIPDVPSTSFVKSLKESFSKAESFRQVLSSQTEVLSTAISVGTYGDNAFWRVSFPREDGSLFDFYVNFVGGDYLETLGLELVEGRGLNPDPGMDSSAMVINETFAKALNWEDPLAEQLHASRFDSHQIVGVVKDYHHASLYSPIEPILFAKSPDAVLSGISNLMIRSNTNPRVLVKLNSGNFERTKAMLEGEWNKNFPGETFEFRFLDETVQSQYANDERLGKMVLMAALIAILIASMGLFAMVALAIAGRTKEIGIRKVLGASEWGISWMFGKEFLSITLIGVFVAIPLSGYLMQSWLSQFAVKEWPSWVSFVLLVVGGVIFTLLIVAFQALKATRLNPVETLKDE
ncbi:ABC transporter permease [Algoriphagus sp. CAU 1675]|uniref:ABC transporter permease n=1 Tax=Algoriphagus sp. CAU 1675 TaxID=3032597 RepID=UPI0023DC03BB|nr:ABC transporter permease [Algoriphagus sp. CAU 1675]MDF2158128.1 ABC transporter permease [Algoriphagus sp. CAU 1675]